MAKHRERIIARRMRLKGESVKEIAKALTVSKSTVSHWTSDIQLSVSQLENLKKRSLSGAEKGRLKAAVNRKKKVKEAFLLGEREALNKLPSTSLNEFFVAGIALYWAEGYKKGRELSFCNSDPRLIGFMIDWFKIFFKISPEGFSIHVGINEIHKKREKVVKEYWSKETKFPLKQFRATSFKKVENKKVYENYDKHYGVLTVKILKSTPNYYKMMGLIKALYQAGMKLAFQDVS